MLFNQECTRAERFDNEGYLLIPGVFLPSDIEGITGNFASSALNSVGTRCLLRQNWCSTLAGRLRRELVGLISDDFIAVQCTSFEKSAGRNWLVPIHQDLSMPVARRVDDPALQGWSEKEGSLFVQGPVEVLEKLVAVRVHLDDCNADDGPLRVVPRSHLQGRIDREKLGSIREESGEVTCQAARGTILLMRPLLLHASSKATGTSRRRVLHFVFGPKRLPSGLAWPLTV